MVAEEFFLHFLLTVVFIIFSSKKRYKYQVFCCPYVWVRYDPSQLVLGFMQKKTARSPLYRIILFRSFIRNQTKPKDLYTTCTNCPKTHCYIYLIQ
jgi:hypothetical protein